jgi:outer membrane lipoprotein carrier protein
MRFRTSLQAIALALTAWLATATSAAALPSVHALARAVDEHYNHMQSLQAEFAEIYQGSGVERVESGTLWLKKPGKMRWEYRSPEEKLFVGDGKVAWLYLPAEKQVRKTSMRNLDDLRSPLAFLLGKSKLEKELRVLSFAPDIQAWKPEDSMLRGVPRGLEDRISQVLLEITPNHQIVRILIHGLDDSITEYRFSDLKENVPLPDGKFQFSAPAGSEVVEEQTGQ